MTAKTQTLPPRREPNVPWLAERSDERILLTYAAIFAVVLHGLAFLIDVPAPEVPLPPPRPAGPTIWNGPLPPPPPPVAQMPPLVSTTRRVPIPAEEPDTNGPVAEPFPDVVDRVPSDVAFEIDVPDFAPAPPTTGPLILTPDIAQPVLIQDSKVAPDYPEVPRRAQMPGSVILQAVIHRDGSVGEVTVLRSSPVGLGFEEAAIAAVQQWRYEPARQLGHPVEVYFTVHVSFEIR